jgi:hypothetical protein
MKAAIVLSLLILAPTTYAAFAAPLGSSNYADIEVVSVSPRSPGVKPFVMAIFTKEQQQRFEAATFKKNSEAMRESGQAR